MVMIGAVAFPGVVDGFEVCGWVGAGNERDEQGEQGQGSEGRESGVGLNGRGELLAKGEKNFRIAAKGYIAGGKSQTGHWGGWDGTALLERVPAAGIGGRSGGDEGENEADPSQCDAEGTAGVFPCAKGEDGGEHRGGEEEHEETADGVFGGIGEADGPKFDGVPEIGAEGGMRFAGVCDRNQYGIDEGNEEHEAKNETDGGDDGPEVQELQLGWKDRCVKELKHM